MRWVGKNKLQRRWRPRPPDRVAAAVIVMTMLIHSVKLAVVVAVSLLHLIKNLRQQVEELNAEVGRQRQVIDTLTTRLNFVLSMFGADEVSLSLLTKILNQQQALLLLKRVILMFLLPRSLFEVQSCQLSTRT